jgi:hypothetical protein
MKTKNSKIRIIARVLAISLFLYSCSLFKDDEPKDSTQENRLEHSYEGELILNYTNTYPEWDVTTTMQVEIKKELGTIHISSTNMSYSGEKIIEDTKLSREGKWILNPVGYVKRDGKREYIEIDAGVEVKFDILKQYILNNLGNWQLINENSISGTPYSTMVFSFEEAEDKGSVVSVTTQGGSMTWTLLLVISIN